MKFLEWNDEQYVRSADVISWLTQFAKELEEGRFGEAQKPYAGIVWNVVAGLIESDLRSIDGVRP